MEKGRGSREKEKRKKGEKGPEKRGEKGPRKVEKGPDSSLLDCRHAPPPPRPSRLGAPVSCSEATTAAPASSTTRIGRLSGLAARGPAAGAVSPARRRADDQSRPSAPPGRPLGATVIIAVGRCYVQHINRTYGHTGTLWDSRYKSSLVQAETYLRLCLRCIEFNPVRANMVADPADYLWSSYRANALGEPNGILTPHLPYLALAAVSGERHEAYRALFRTALEDAPLAALRLSLNQNQHSVTTASTARSKRSPANGASRTSGVASENRPSRIACETYSSKNGRSNYTIFEPEPGWPPFHLLFT
jgi:hypothetical protein